MTIRSSLNIILVIVLAVGIGVFQSASDRGIKAGLHVLQKRQDKDVLSLLSHFTSDKEVYLRNLNRLIESNAELSSTYILSTESEDHSQITALLSKIQSEANLDYLNIVSTKGALLNPDQKISRCLSKIKKTGDDQIFACEVNGNPILASTATLYLYGEPAGHLILGLNLNHHLGTNGPSGVEFVVGKQKIKSNLDYHLIGSFASGNLFAKMPSHSQFVAGVMHGVRNKFILFGVIVICFVLILNQILMQLAFVRPVRGLVKRIDECSADVERGRFGTISGDFFVEEVKLIATAFNRLMASLATYYETAKLQTEKIVKFEREAALAKMAKQVAHDIRSPLSALNVVLFSLKDLPEETRNLIRNVAQRINDIANDLIQQNPAGSSVKQSETSNTVNETVMLSALLDSIVSEKRAQYRNDVSIEIRGELSGSYGLFSLINSAELSRAISNLINNSVEAAAGKLIVIVGLVDAQDKVRITIKDNGKGIPEDILKKLGQKGVTYGKDLSKLGSGSGLGVYHARKIITEANGELVIKSTLGQGTETTIDLPKSKPPHWFINGLIFVKGSKLVSVDDDMTIHQIWHSRLAAMGSEASNVELITLSDPDQLISWVRENGTEKAWILVDFEFLNQSKDGLNAIDELKIKNQVVLVTSRYDDPQVVKRVENLGIKMLPKSLAPFIPMLAKDN